MQQNAESLRDTRRESGKLFRTEPSSRGWDPAVPYLRLVEGDTGM